jgi:hypothetical protein
MYSVFNGWKTVFLREKRFVQTLSNLATKLDHFYMALSMIKLKSEANIVTVSLDKKRKKGARIAFKFLSYFTVKKTLEALNKFKYNLLE